MINANCFLNVALVFGIVTLVTDLVGAILHDREVAVFVTLSFVGNIDTVHDEGASGLTGGHVVVGRVDARYDGTLVVLIASSRFLIESRHLLSELRHTIIGWIHILVGCKQLDRVNVQICRGDKHFHLIPIFVVRSN